MHGLCIHYTARCCCSICWSHQEKCYDADLHRQQIEDLLSRGEAHLTTEESLEDYVSNNGNITLDQSIKESREMGDICDSTKQNKTITLPPRRYLLLGKTMSLDLNEKLQELTTKIQLIHTVENAPEPMNIFTSHFQLLQNTLDQYQILVSLTNTCSRKTRQEIFHNTITILNIDYTTMIYQEQTEEDLIRRWISTPMHR